MRSGSWLATSRQVILAWARPGMIVLLPSPEKPPQIPFTSSVGRAPRRSVVVQPDSPTSAGTSSSRRSASSSSGRAANATRSASERATTSS